jgi:hypothetical protein
MLKLEAHEAGWSTILIESVPGGPCRAKIWLQTIETAHSRQNEHIKEVLT